MEVLNNKFMEDLNIEQIEDYIIHKKRCILNDSYNIYFQELYKLFTIFKYEQYDIDNNSTICPLSNKPITKLIVFDCFHCVDSESYCEKYKHLGSTCPICNNTIFYYNDILYEHRCMLLLKMNYDRCTFKYAYYNIICYDPLMRVNKIYIGYKEITDEYIINKFYDEVKKYNFESIFEKLEKYDYGNRVNTNQENVVKFLGLKTGTILFNVKKNIHYKIDDLSMYIYEKLFKVLFNIFMEDRKKYQKYILIFSEDSKYI